MRGIIPLLLVSLLITSCSSGHCQTKEQPQPAEAVKSSTEPDIYEIAGNTTSYRWVAGTRWADSTLGSLSLRDKVAQIIVPFTYAPYLSNNNHKIAIVRPVVHDAVIEALLDQK